MARDLIWSALDLIGSLCWLATVLWVVSRYMRGWRLVWKSPSTRDDACPLCLNNSARRLRQTDQQ